MGNFDEVCPLCGVSPAPPRELTGASDIVAEELAGSLLKHFPTIVEDCQRDGIDSKESLQDFLQNVMDNWEPSDMEDCGRAFMDCIAIGYFEGDEGEVPYEKVDDKIVERRIPDGKMVTTRLVDYPGCGDFEQLVFREPGSDPRQEECLTRTGAYWQNGIGNFFLSECCYKFLKEWISLAALPSMRPCDRQLSFEGELWEIFNSRESGRGETGYEWLSPGGAEKKLEQDQYQLATRTEDMIPFKTAEALKMGLNGESMMSYMYEDYGYWMFVTPHRQGFLPQLSFFRCLMTLASSSWPRADDATNLGALSFFGFDTSPRSSGLSLPLNSNIGSLSRFTPEILVQIFGWLPSLMDYLNLKAVSKRMHDLVIDSKFTAMVLREMLKPDTERGLYWVYPIAEQPEEGEDFLESLETWVTEPSDEVAEDFIFSPEFPLVHFICELYRTNSTRNRRRLWNTVQQLKDIWVDYRLNGWKVDRFGVAYPNTEAAK